MSYNSKWDRARFYDNPRKDLNPKPRYPSVTTIIGDTWNKSDAILSWGVKLERNRFRDVLFKLLGLEPPPTLDKIKSEVEFLTTGSSVATKEKVKAALIGQAAHAWIDWYVHEQANQSLGPEPKIPVAAQTVVAAWKEWAADAGFKLIVSEKKLHCHCFGYAGTMDTGAEVYGKRAVIDYKTSNAIHSEHHLQVGMYKHAAEDEGLLFDEMYVIRFPKTVEDLDYDQLFEPLKIPPVPKDVIESACRLWRFHRQAQGAPIE